MNGYALIMKPQREQQISKAISWLLRHGGQKEGINFRSDAFAKVTDILSYKRLKDMKVTFEEFEHVVKSNDKQRFLIQEEINEQGIPEAWIKATQGHSMVFKDISIKRIENANQIPVAIHGTYMKHIDSIFKNGLSKMNRTHIHFSVGKPGDKKVISGMRPDCNVLIYLDVQKCLDNGIELYISENNVVLTEGENGILDKKFFLKVVDIKTGSNVNL